MTLRDPHPDPGLGGLGTALPCRAGLGVAESLRMRMCTVTNPHPWRRDIVAPSFAHGNAVPGHNTLRDPHPDPGFGGLGTPVPCLDTTHSVTRIQTPASVGWAPPCRAWTQHTP
jgi:hypothetical protein